MCTIDHGDQCTEALEVSNHEVHFLKCFDGQFISLKNFFYKIENLQVSEKWKHCDDEM